MGAAELCNRCRPGIGGLRRLSAVRTYRCATDRLQSAAPLATNRPQLLIQPPQHVPPEEPHPFEFGLSRARFRTFGEEGDQSALRRG